MQQEIDRIFAANFNVVQPAPQSLLARHPFLPSNPNGNGSPLACGPTASSEIKLGNGAYGSVKLHINKSRTQQFITKTQQDKDAYNRELEFASKTKDCPFVTQLLGTKINHGQPDDYILNFEFCAHGTWLNVINDHNLMTYKLLAVFVNDTLEALAFLQIRNIIHSDIKPENIGISENWRAKVFDFGLAHNGPRRTPAGTLEYQSTEHIQFILQSFLQQNPPRIRSAFVDDIYSLGISILQTVIHTLPGHRYMELHPHHTRQGQDEYLCIIEGRKEINIRQLKNSPYFKNQNPNIANVPINGFI
jgi:serine/threonine protein kinase